MNTLIQLPRTADVDAIGKGLKIRDHKVINGNYLLNWLFGISQWDEWSKVLPQMISQGFKIGAVIEECIMDLVKFDLSWFLEIGCSHDKIDKLPLTLTGRRIRAELKKRLQACKNWNDLIDVINPKGEFSKKISKRARWAVRNESSD